MDALLILGGLLLILAGLVWLVMRAFSTSLLWGWGSFFPPLTLVYVFRNWRTARQAVALSGLGFIPLIVGLTMLASHDAQRLAAIVSLQWLQPARQDAPDLAIDLKGELHGQPFAPQQGELIDGVLSLREGQDFFASREVIIRLPRPITEGDVRLDVLPADSGPLPEVEISWLLPEQELPEARRLSQGYTLHLDLRAVPPNRLAGDFHLVLPTQLRTTLSGRVELYRDGLRYVDGQVDVRHDSADTLVYVVRDYLQRRFVTRDVQLAPLPPANLLAESLPLQVDARVAGEAKTLALQLSKRSGRGWAVDDDTYAPLKLAEEVTSARAEPGTDAQRPAAEPRAARKVDRRVRFDLDGLLRRPDRYQNLSMRAHTTRGGVAEGHFQGIDNEGRIVLRPQRQGPGEVSYALRPEEIRQLELLEP